MNETIGAEGKPSCVISIILCTYGRYDDVERFLLSLREQNLEGCELLVVDQNPNDKIKSLLDRLELSCAVLWLKCTPGLSRSRNMGISRAKGEYCMFPDDDCAYPEGLLEVVKDRLMRDSLDGLTVRAKGLTGGEVGPNWQKKPGPLTRSSIWRQAISYTIVIRLRKCGSTIRFLENLGVGSGSAIGSGEETEMLLFCLRNGWKVEYEPSIRVLHPEVVEGSEDLVKMRSYSVGSGYVMGLHGFSFLTVMYKSIRPVLSSMLGRGHCRGITVGDSLKIAGGIWQGYGMGRGNEKA